MGTPVTSAPRFAALQHRNFTLLWSGLIVSNVGTWMQNVAQGWLVLQLTNSPLFPVEQVAIGGRYTVRGYREVTILRDNSFIASVEPRFPLYRWGNGTPMFQLAPFVDVAHGWNLGGNRGAPTQPITTFPDTLASIGVGLRWNILPDDRASFEVYWGQQLNHVPTINNTIQDNGVHLGIVINLF